ncbi:hypothetical protein Mapa_008991 [Marchantia paleacea]|nr:hypothetical protein Mapa_008991 [Marchantia paleacea]
MHPLFILLEPKPRRNNKRSAVNNCFALTSPLVTYCNSTRDRVTQLSSGETKDGEQ